MCTGGTVAVTALPAAAQMDSGTPGVYYDGSNDEVMRHVVAGTIANSSPYRVLLSVGEDRTVQVDLENGTTIKPTGTNLSSGMHVEAHGHWSKGTFIADEVDLKS